MATVEILHSSASCEWYTPAKYVEAVRAALVSIELDPASCAEANKTVQAQRYFTAEQDGICLEWNANTVFLNPPYGRRNGKSNQDLWIGKLLREFNNGRTREAILLVNACPYLSWFKPLWDYPICFTDHKIRFDSESGANSPTKGNAFVYFGSDQQSFFDHFEQFGKVILA
jgi:ParB family chromosome partitioning protein